MAEVARDPIPVYIAEYESLRREIETRATLSSSLVALELSALGIGLVAAGNQLDLYVGLAFLSTILWLFWLDHTEQIWKLATYISLGLRPSLTEVAEHAFEWEAFLRSLDRRRPVRSTNYAALYITLLFATIPPILVVVFVVQVLNETGQSTPIEAARLLVAAMATAFWGFALFQFWQFTSSRNTMDSWILNPDTFAPDGDGH